MKHFSSAASAGGWNLRDTQSRYQVVFMNLEPNANWPKETHPGMDQLFFVFSGTGKAKSGATNTILLQPGDALTVPAGVEHEIAALERGLQMWSVYTPVKPGVFQHDLLPQEKLRAVLADAPPEYQGTIESLLQRMEAVAAGQTDEHAHLLVEAAQQWTELIGKRGGGSIGVRRRRRRQRKSPAKKGTPRGRSKSRSRSGSRRRSTSAKKKTPRGRSKSRSQSGQTKSAGSGKQTSRPRKKSTTPPRRGRSKSNSPTKKNNKSPATKIRKSNSRSPNRRNKKSTSPRRTRSQSNSPKIKDRKSSSNRSPRKRTSRGRRRSSSPSAVTTTTNRYNDYGPGSTWGSSAGQTDLRPVDYIPPARRGLQQTEFTPDSPPMRQTGFTPTVRPTAMTAPPVNYSRSSSASSSPVVSPRPTRLVPRRPPGEVVVDDKTYSGDGGRVERFDLDGNPL